MKSLFNLLNKWLENNSPQQSVQLLNNLINRFSFPAFKIPEDECAQVIQRSKECFAIIGFGKFIYKSLQIRIAGDHKGGDRNFNLFTLCGQVQTRAVIFLSSPKLFL